MTIQNLLETSVPKNLRHVPKQWEHHSEVDAQTKQKISNAMRGSNFTHFPLPETRSEPDADVLEYLYKHGYDVHDYEKGIASKVTQVGDPSRGIPLRDKVVHEKIGSVLDRTGADSDIKSAFMNDPARSAVRSNKSDMHVVVSTSPLAIAGMSTGTCWDDKSCMNLVKGGNRDYLKRDSEHGTHVAYLVHGSDHAAFEHGEPENPIARIALKPYHAETPQGRDTIFLPEHKTWGMNDSRFSNAIHEWARANYPAKEGHTYKKNEHVYDDSGNRYHQELNQEEFDRLLHADSIPANVSVSHDVVTNAIKNTEKLSPNDRKKQLNKVSKIVGLSSKNISLILNAAKNFDEANNDNIHYNLGESNGDRLPKSALKHFDDYASFGIPKRVLMNPKLSSETIDNLPISNYPFVRRSNLKPHHIDRVVNKYIEGTGDLNSTNLNDLSSKLSKQNIRDITDKAINRYTSFIVHSPNFDKEEHDHWFDVSQRHFTNYGEEPNYVLQHSPYASVDDLDKVNSKKKLFSLINNKNISEHEKKRVKDYFIDKAVNNTESKQGKLTKYIYPQETPNGFMQDSNIESEYTIPKHLSDHFTDKDYSDLAAKKYSLKFEDVDHSHKYLDAIHKHIIDADAAGDESATKYHLSTYLASIRKHAINHGGPNDNTVNDEFDNTLERLTNPSHHGSVHNLKTVDAPNTEKFTNVLNSLVGYRDYHTTT